MIPFCAKREGEGSNSDFNTASQKRVTPLRKSSIHLRVPGDFQIPIAGNNSDGETEVWIAQSRSLEVFAKFLGRNFCYIIEIVAWDILGPFADAKGLVGDTSARESNCRSRRGEKEKKRDNQKNQNPFHDSPPWSVSIIR